MYTFIQFLHYHIYIKPYNIYKYRILFKSLESGTHISGFRQTNSLSVNVQLPNAILPESIIIKLRNKITSNFDLVNAFFNIKLDRESRRYCAFFFEKSKYQFVRLTQGLNSSPGALAKLLSLMFSEKVFKKVKSNLNHEEKQIAAKFKEFGDFTYYYFDDIWVSSSGDIKEHLVCLKLLFGALEYGGVLLSPKKCTLYASEVNVLGLTVQTISGNILMDYKRGLSFVTMQKPSSLYELSSRLSSLNYFRNFIPKLKEISTIFYIMLKEGEFRWTEKEEFAWNRLKAVLLLDIKLTIPDESEQLVVTTDASNLASSQCLWVLRDGQLYLVSTSSKLFNSSQFLKPTHYKETMSLMYAMKIFYPYLLMSKKRTIFLTDARNLIVLNRSKQHSILAGGMAEYISRMCMLLKFQIFSCPSSVNWMADLISRSVASSRHIDKVRSKYTISKEFLTFLPKIQFNLNVSQDILLKMFSNEIEPLKEDTGKREKSRPKTLADTFKMYLDSTPEEAFLSSLLFLKEISRDLCNIKLDQIGISLDDLDITLKEEYAQKQLLKKSTMTQEKSKLKALINTIILKTMEEKFGHEYRPGDKTKIKNCLTENFMKMITDPEEEEIQIDPEESLSRIQNYIELKQSEKTSEINVIFEADKEADLVSCDMEDAGYDFVMPESVDLAPGEKRLINTEIKLKIPPFHCGILFLRSSAFSKLRIWHGVIDSGFVGKVKFFVENTSDENLTLEKGGRYVQILILPIHKKLPKKGKVIKNSNRKKKGFGSTGLFEINTEKEEEDSDEEREMEWYRNMSEILQNIRKDLDAHNVNMDHVNELYKQARKAAEEDFDYENIDEEDDTDNDENEENIYEEIGYGNEETKDQNLQRFIKPKESQDEDKHEVFYDSEPKQGRSFSESENNLDLDQEKPKSNKQKSVSFSDGQLVEEIRYIDQEIKEKAKSSFLETIKSKFRGQSDESDIHEEVEHKTKMNFQISENSDPANDSFKRYRSKKKSESDSEYESNYISFDSDECENFIECYTTLAENFEKSDITDQAIKAAQLSITMITQDSISAEKLSELQHSCETLTKIRESRKNNFEEINGLLYHTIDNVKRLCIPQILITNCIKVIHEKYAHSSIDMTNKIFNRYYYYPAVLKIIQVYVKHCLTCTLCKWSFKNRSESDSRSVRAYKPLDIISMDIIPNLPRTKESYTCMLVLMDEFSTHIFAYPLKDRSSNEVLKQLKNFISTVGFPTYFRSDQETSLISALQTLKKSYPILTLYSNAYQHQQNNVESGICHFKQIMNKLIYDGENPRQKSEWYECTIIALNIMNSEIPDMCTSTRRELFYSLKNIPPFLSGYTYGEGKRDIDHDTRIRSKTHEKNRTPVKKHDFSIHQLVILRNHQPPTTGTSGSFRLKMSTNIYIITDITEGSRSIVIKDIETGKEKTVNSEDLQILPIENYFFSCKDLGFDKKIVDQIEKVTGSSLEASPDTEVTEMKTTNTTDPENEPEIRTDTNTDNTDGKTEENIKSRLRKKQS